MKSIIYISISLLLTLFSALPVVACGPYLPEEAGTINFFRCCTPHLASQWQDGCRFQDYEKEQNCILWQQITSTSIPYKDIEEVIYSARFSDLKDLTNHKFSNNKFAQWLRQAGHKDDYAYILTAKEIEAIRNTVNDPWYYPYDGDEEHIRLRDLTDTCKSYTGRRHAARYQLQLARIYFALTDYDNCIKLWEEHVASMPRNIVTDMTASYAGGAYSRRGAREKAIELFTRSQDIGSLIALGAWDDMEKKSTYRDNRIKEMEYVFNRFPNSPLLSVKLQTLIRYLENNPNWHDSDDKLLFKELKCFIKQAINSGKSGQQGMWWYTLAYLYYLDNDIPSANIYLDKAHSFQNTPFIDESLRAFRFLLDAHLNEYSDNYTQWVLANLTWLDKFMARDISLIDDNDDNWQYRNKMNYSFYYWQDVARKVLIGHACPKLIKSGNTTLALQLANYATNRIYQLSPEYEDSYYAWNEEKGDYDYIKSTSTFDEYRKSTYNNNYYDYSNQFFRIINSLTASQAERYAHHITSPSSYLERFLNDRSYVDTDYIYDIVGTLYMREMKYGKAVEWLSKVSTDYQQRTNINKNGYFKLDPFKYQSNKKHYIIDTADYKLRFAQEMAQLELTFNSDAEPNRRAQAMILYATGLGNSFDKCWYLTDYSLYTHDYLKDWYPDYPFDTHTHRVEVCASKASDKIDKLLADAMGTFTDPEKAAKVQLDMMNFATVIRNYPNTTAAAFIRSHCDNYYDYCLPKKQFASR